MLHGFLLRNNFGLKISARMAHFAEKSLENLPSRERKGGSSHEIEDFL